MTAYQPVFHSPIDAPAQFAGLADLTGAPVTLIQGRAGEWLARQFGAWPANPGELVEAGEGWLACLTPTEFYLCGAALPAPLSAGLHATDLTHGQAIVRLAGPAAAKILRKICGLDFREAAFPNRHAAQTSAAKIKTLIARVDEGETAVYYLHVGRPLGQYFWDVVREAGQEFGPG
jgi:heterotetrameric sarcosine oxidase gamma subunit